MSNVQPNAAMEHANADRDYDNGGDTICDHRRRRRVGISDQPSKQANVGNHHDAQPYLEIGYLLLDNIKLGYD